LKAIETRVESAWVQHLKLKWVEAFSNYGFSFNLRRYSVAAIVNAAHDRHAQAVRRETMLQRWGLALEREAGAYNPSR
jgi:hypothetical protein